MKALFLPVIGIGLAVLGALSIPGCAPKAVSSGSLSQKQVGKVSTDDMSVAILYFVNQRRKAVGRIPIQLNSLESALASHHSLDMAEGKVPLGHDGFSFRMQLMNQQLGGIAAAAENVARGQMTAREVVEDWLRSPTHRKNIEGYYTLTGIGCAKGPNGQIYYTEIFSR
jgi:uncharacterized protein YkwD